jgi:hypothetical protein
VEKSGQLIHFKVVCTLCFSVIKKMSLVVTCNKCGQTISLRKMPHGRHVPFDLRTNNPHKCGSRKGSKGKGVEARGKKTPAISPAEAPEVEAELPLPVESSGKGTFSNENLAKYEEFFAAATPPKTPDALLPNSKEGPSGPRPWVWAVLSALITALCFSIYLNLTAKPKVVVVEKKNLAPAPAANHAQNSGSPAKEAESQKSEDYDFVPDPPQSR